MKTIRFTAYPDGYRCDVPGDQSGEYVKVASDVEAELQTLRNQRAGLFYCLSRLLDELPTHRDWLDPILEKQSHAVIKTLQEQDISRTDNSEPITEEWLLSIGFKKVRSPLGPTYRDNLELGRVNVWEFNDSGKWLFNEADWIEMTTRREIRMLLELAKEKTI